MLVIILIVVPLHIKCQFTYFLTFYKWNHIQSILNYLKIKRSKNTFMLPVDAEIDWPKQCFERNALHFYNLWFIFTLHWNSQFVFHIDQTNYLSYVRMTAFPNRFRIYILFFSQTAVRNNTARRLTRVQKFNKK